MSKSARRNSAFDLLAGDVVDNEDLGNVMARSGHLVDTAGSIWLLGAESSVNWSAFSDVNRIVLRSIREFARFLIRNSSPRYVVAQVVYLQKLSSETVALAIENEIEQTGGIGTSTYEAFKKEARETIGVHWGDYLGSFKRWYLWNTDTGNSAFDEDFAVELDQVIIGGGPTAEAVMREDPRSGPLREQEYEALQSRLRSPMGDRIPLKERVAAWLYICFGCNSKNLRLLAEEDLRRTDLSDGTSSYELRIPHIKKRTPGERDQFRTRSVIPAIGIQIEELIRQNHSIRKSTNVEEGRYFQPLFRSDKPRKALINTPFEHDIFRIGPRDLAEMLILVTAMLELQSFQGGPLHLTPRRLRYTFATKLVRDGASPQEVADALDHTSTAHIMVYFNVRSDIVRSLDLAMGLALAPIAQAFMGKIVRSEGEATRGADKASRIRHYSPTMKSLETVGSCGSFSFCGMFAPLACYTCCEFQPWLDGPHRQVFEALEAKRMERLSRGADPKMTQIHDRTMIAIADVIARCDEFRKREGEA